jgi:hypothetical protein
VPPIRSNHLLRYCCMYSIDDYRVTLGSCIEREGFQRLPIRRVTVESLPTVLPSLSPLISSEDRIMSFFSKNAPFLSPPGSAGISHLFVTAPCRPNEGQWSAPPPAFVCAHIELDVVASQAPNISIRVACLPSDTPEPFYCHKTKTAGGIHCIFLVSCLHEAKYVAC